MSENFDFRGGVVMRVSTIPREGVEKLHNHSIKHNYSGML